MPNHYVKGLALTILLSMTHCTELRAQQGRGWGPKSPYNSLYDASTQVEVEGTIDEIQTKSPLMGMSIGIHLIQKTGSRRTEVHLGPSWYLQNQEPMLAKGDAIKVLGSKVQIDNRQVIIARRITKGTQILELRDQSGRPYWAGWRRRHCCGPP